MLEIVTSLSELNMSQLKQVYEESISTLAMNRYSKFHENLQILNAEQDFYADVSAFFDVAGAEYALWISDGRYVSAIRLEPVDNGHLLTSFETAPTARSKGFGKMLMKAVVESVSRNKKSCIYSHIDESNVSSLKVHQHCGFRSLQYPAVFVDGSVQKDYVTYVFDIKDPPM